MIAIAELYQLFKNSTGICTDTRKIVEGCLFFALKGNNFNGNTFASQALSLGAHFAIVDEEAFVSGHHTILVPDVLETLQQLASFHRDTLSIPIIAIGGSNGKTTTKELTHKVLKTKFNCFATAGNFNNHIGVPLSLLQITPEHQMAVIEMGANHIGEYEELCAIAKPTHGLITNIGKDHLEGFGSLAGVAQANSELYYYLLKNNGVVFLNTQEEILVQMATRFQNKFTYPAPDDNFTCTLIADGLFFIKIECNGELVQTQLTGAYNFANVATALCVGHFFNVPLKDAFEAIAAYKPSNMRSQVIETGNNLLLLDAYNANPSSVEVAIQNLDSISFANKGVILGNMAELGADTQKEHAAIVELLQSKGFQLNILVGEYYAPFKEEVGMLYFPTIEGVLTWLSNNALQSYCLLIKGSRSAKLERVLEVLYPEKTARH